MFPVHETNEAEYGWPFKPGLTAPDSVMLRHDFTSVRR